MDINKVNIRPGVSILSVLKHLNYKPWFALAEFVDNAIDSYIKNEKALKSCDGEHIKLKVTINGNHAKRSITIKDNAAGIHERDFERAFRAAEIPPNNIGLSEFGMGMKSAACWFAQNWIVESSALGETVERIVIFDIKKIVDDKIEELDVKNIVVSDQKHGTTIKLLDIQNFPEKKTIGKIKDHLTSIYRDFIRQGVLDLYFNDELLVYEESKILEAPYYKTPDGQNIIWKKEIEEFPIRDGLKVVKGFVALLETQTYNKTGLALFRRGRVILGSGDEGFKPQDITGSIGSNRDKRVFGELHIEGFQVSHTKDGFKNDDDMQLFIELLADELRNSDFPLLQQAEGYRKNPTDKDYKKSATEAVKETVEIAKKNLPNPVKHIIDQEKQPESVEQILMPINENKSSYETFEIKFNSVDWVINVELSWENSLVNWIEIGDKFAKKIEYENPKLYRNVRQIGIRLALRHPFCEKFASTDKARIIPLLRLAVAIGLSEVIARESGISNSSFFRNNINKLLTEALSK